MIIFLYGLDTFRSRRKLKELKEKFINEVDKSALNIQILDGQKLEKAEFENAISTSPFLAKKRLVLIENLISKNKGQKIQKEILETLNKNNLDNVIIIFWEGEVSQEKSRSKVSKKRSGLLFNKLKQEKYAQEFNLLEPAGCIRFIQQEINFRGAKITPQALKLLSNLVGNDLWQMNSEINKLISLFRDKIIDDQGVKNTVKTKIDENIFKLTDALGQKDKKMALKLISDQLKNGTTPTELLSKMVWQFKNLLLIKEFAEKNGYGYSPSNMNYQLGIHPFVIKKTMAQTKNYNLDDLKKTYAELLQIDYKIKTSQIEPEVLFDLLVIKS